MSMLARYRKSGGFLQILKLIETCGKQKQDNFLKMIEEEDPKWAEALREKMLTIDKILSWDDNTVSEISARLQQMTLATALLGLPPESCEKLLKMFSHSQKRVIDDIKAAKESNPGEISAAFTKIIEEVRGLIKEGDLRVEKFAPELIVPDGIEEKLGKNMGTSVLGDSDEPSAPPNMDAFGGGSKSNGGAGTASSADVNALRQKVSSLNHENQLLKNELKIAKDKLTQIKRIA
jgi:hypothetical protein